MQGLFITGNHTGVGKTTIAQVLIQYYQQKYTLKVRKPIESGCIKQAGQTGQLIPRDAQKLLNWAGNNETLLQVCPYRFAAYASGEAASQMAKVELSLLKLINAVKNNVQPRDFVLVEGAGGLYSPMANDALNIDLIFALALPLVIVIKDELGAVNQALLTINAATQAGLKIIALVLNQFDGLDKNVLELNNKVVIEKYSKMPVYVYRHQRLEGFEGF